MTTQGWPPPHDSMPPQPDHSWTLMHIWGMLNELRTGQILNRKHVGERIDDLKTHMGERMDRLETRQDHFEAGAKASDHGQAPGWIEVLIKEAAKYGAPIATAWATGALDFLKHMLAAWVHP